MLWLVGWMMVWKEWNDSSRDYAIVDALLTTMMTTRRRRLVERDALLHDVIVVPWMISLFDL